MDAFEDLLETPVQADGGQVNNERFNRLTAVWIAILAVLMAIVGLGGENTAEAVVYNNILASDYFAWYQAKNVRQTNYELAADELQYLLDIQRDDLSPQEVAALEERVAQYRATVARYESEPYPEDPDNPLRGEGKRELLAQALYYEEARDRALMRDPNFDYATVLYQIAIVLASVAILAASRLLVALSGGLGAVATFLTLNGFVGFMILPF